MEHESLLCCPHHGRGSTPGEVCLLGMLPQGTQCQPGTRAGTQESARAPQLSQHHDHDTWCPSHPQPHHPVPKPHTLLPQDSQTACWPWSAASASFPVKSQSRSALVLKKLHPTTTFRPEESPVTMSEYTQFILSQCSQLKLLLTEKC